MSTKNEKTFVERSLSELRKEINIVTEDELKAKNFACTFSETTHKLTSIKSTEKKEKNDRVKEQFEKLQEELLRRYNLKLSLTESYSLRCINIVDRDAKKNEQTKQTEQTEQTEQQAA